MIDTNLYSLLPCRSDREELVEVNLVPLDTDLPIVMQDNETWVQFMWEPAAMKWVELEPDEYIK